MLKLKIIKKNKYDYTLEDSSGNKYNLNIEFYDLEEALNVGDYIYISEKIVKEINIFSFGHIENNIDNINEEDIIKVIIKEKEYYLQRYYG